MGYWAVLIGSCVMVTILATLIVKRPMLAAIGVSLIAGIGTSLYGARHSALWLVGSAIVIICSLPLTIITGMITDSLRARWDPGPR